MSTKAASISEVPDEFMKCRAWRQHLFTKDDDGLVTRGGKVVGIRRWRQCGRCGYEVTTEESVTRGRWARVGRPKPRYQPGYLVTGGVDRDEAKEEYVGRLLRGGATVVPIRRSS